MALQRRVHQLGATALSNCGFDDRQRQFSDSQPLPLDNVRPLQISAPRAHTVAMRMIA